MRKLTRITTFIAVLVLFAVPLFSDTLVLKSGERVSGYFEGGSARVVKFRANDGIVKDYDILSVQQLVFGDEKSPLSSSTRSTTSSANQTTPRLVPGNERVTRPSSSSAADKIGRASCRERV